MRMLGTARLRQFSTRRTTAGARARQHSRRGVMLLSSGVAATISGLGIYYLSEGSSLVTGGIPVHMASSRDEQRKREIALRNRQQNNKPHEDNTLHKAGTENTEPLLHTLGLIIDIS